MTAIQEIRQIHPNPNPEKLVIDEVLKLKTNRARRCVNAVKKPDMIPFFNSITTCQAAKYFDVADTRIENLVVRDREYFHDNRVVVPAMSIINCLPNEKVLIQKRCVMPVYDCKTPAGNTIRMNPKTTYALFNDKALLTLAVMLRYESKVAADLCRVLCKTELSHLFPVEPEKVSKTKPNPRKSVKVTINLANATIERSVVS